MPLIVLKSFRAALVWWVEGLLLLVTLLPVSAAVLALFAAGTLLLPLPAPLAAWL